MTMAHSKFVPNDMKKSVIKIYGYDEMNLSGIIANNYLENELGFKSTTHLLKLLDQLHNEINYPEKSMQPRSFAKAAAHCSAGLPKTPELQKSKKALASFEISILFRQNASWQGSLIWMEKEASAEFRSVLELIFLIDGVLSEMRDNR